MTLIFYVNSSYGADFVIFGDSPPVLLFLAFHGFTFVSHWIHHEFTVDSQLRRLGGELRECVHDKLRARRPPGQMDSGVAEELERGVDVLSVFDGVEAKMMMRMFSAAHLNSS